MVSLTIDADETGAVDLPSPVAVTMVTHGPMAAQLRAAKSQIGPKEQADMISTILQSAVGEGQFAETSITPDAATGDVTIRARGVVNTSWTMEDRRRKRWLGGALSEMDFSPDRSRPDWNNIPVAAPPPMGLERHVRVMLPDGGRGFTIDGTPDAKQQLAA